MDVRTNRYVVTYQPGEWPAGVLTGYDDEQGGWALEWTIAFDRSPATLVAMFRAGLEEAWGRGFRYVVFHVPHAYPQAEGLMAVGRRVGFTEYSRDERHVYFVCHSPAAQSA